MSMTITITADKKELLGKALAKKGFTEEAEYFFKYSYFSNKDKESVTIECDITIAFLDALDIVSGEMELRGLMTQTRQLKQLINDPAKTTIKSLKGFASGVANYIGNGIINGWLYQYKVTEVYSPMLVENIKFKPAQDKDDKATTTISFIYNCAKKGGVESSKLTFFQEDVLGKTIPQVLSDKFNLFKETAAHRLEYDKSIEAYKKHQPEFGKQFRVIGNVKAQNESGYSNECLKVSKGRRLVNNEEGIGKTRRFGAVTDNSYWKLKGIKGNAINEVPFHASVFCFDLEEHENIWISSLAIEPYQYNPSLKDKIVLPKQHEELITILIDDMEVVREDFVEGKSGGTIILCMGAPGLGKTLTAEIYSEVVKRPLYRVHSGQLGTNPDTIEKRLAEVLLRAERWGAILLLDEADCFIRERNNDMNHNAIVASFLRRLEYYSGMLFMTTNRVNDCDDAILSRCSAILKYQHPDKAQRKAIWTNLSQQFNMDVKPSVITELVDEFPVICGRDIKDLLKLADKYNRIKNRPLTLETFSHCAIFRGVEHRTPEVEAD